MKATLGVQRGKLVATFDDGHVIASKGVVGRDDDANDAFFDELVSYFGCGPTPRRPHAEGA